VTLSGTNAYTGTVQVTNGATIDYSVAGEIAVVISVPEPAVLSMLGLAGLLGRRRRA
jgi:hypothetical protein